MRVVAGIAVVASILGWGQPDGTGSLGHAAATPALPQLPRISDARVVLGTKVGTAIRVSYCYETLPADAAVRPARLHLTVENLRDDLPPLSVGWSVTARCGRVLHPVGPIQQPFVLRYTTESATGARSNQGQIRLALRPELARKPSLPTSLAARLGPHPEYGRAVRVSYCFASLPRDPSRRPELLAITLVSTSDEHAARGYNTRVTKRCDMVAFPLAGIPGPYVVRYLVRSERGTYSKRGEVPVR